MEDVIRREMLDDFCSIYDPSAFDLLFKRMPMYREDSSGELFNLFFATMQTLYALQGKWEKIEDGLLSKLEQDAEKSGYPKHQIYNLRAVKV